MTVAKIKATNCSFGDERTQNEQRWRGGERLNNGKKKEQSNKRGKEKNAKKNGGSG